MWAISLERMGQIFSTGNSVLFNLLSPVTDFIMSFYEQSFERRDAEKVHHDLKMTMSHLKLCRRTFRVKTAACLNVQGFLISQQSYGLTLFRIFKGFAGNRDRIQVSFML